RTWARARRSTTCSWTWCPRRVLRDRLLPGGHRRDPAAVLPRARAKAPAARAAVRHPGPRLQPRVVGSLAAHLPARLRSRRPPARGLPLASTPAQDLKGDRMPGRRPVLVAFLLGLIAGRATAGEAALPDEKTLLAMSARFAPADIGADLKALPESERRALAKLVDASRLLDAIFLRQGWAGNESLLLELVNDRSPLGQARLGYFLLMKGPWSRIDDAPFLPGVGEKPGGANFYPADATRAEVETWLQSLPEAARREATGFFTTIRRPPGGG